MKVLLLLVVYACSRGPLCGQLPVNGLIAGSWEAHPYFEEECRRTFVAYLASLNVLGSKDLTIAEKEKLLPAFQQQIWSSDSVMVYDDLYMEGDRQQYFPGPDYLRTIPAWYPGGVQFDAAGFRLVSAGWTSESGLLAECTWKRFLEGKDFLGAMQRDSLCLSGVLEFPVERTADVLKIGLPRFRLIRCPPPVAEPRGQSAWAGDTGADTAHTSVSYDTIPPGIRATDESLMAAAAPQPDLRAQRLQSAYTAYTLLNSQPRRPKRNAKPAWQPW
jgi:hypothetical protein